MQCPKLIEECCVCNLSQQHQLPVHKDRLDEAQIRPNCLRNGSICSKSKAFASECTCVFCPRNSPESGGQWKAHFTLLHKTCQLESYSVMSNGVKAGCV